MLHAKGLAKLSPSLRAMNIQSSQGDFVWTFGHLAETSGGHRHRSHLERALTHQIPHNFGKVKINCDGQDLNPSIHKTLDHVRNGELGLMAAWQE